MNFSLILNSRHRPQLLGHLLESIHDTTKNPTQIEVLVSFDNDDLESYDFVKEHAELWPWAKFEFIERDRNLSTRINRLANMANGRFIFVLNDDVEFVTNGWDEIALNQLDIVADDIIYGRTRDNSCDKENTAQYASFPIISKRAVQTLGFFMPPIFVGLGGDVLIWRIFNDVNRVVDVDLDLRHILHETVELVFNPDQTAAEMRANTYANPIDIWNVDLTEYINRLKDGIDGHSIR
jgi:hypothetical protein